MLKCFKCFPLALLTLLFLGFIQAQIFGGQTDDEEGPPGRGHGQERHGHGQGNGHGEEGHGQGNGHGEEGQGNGHGHGEEGHGQGNGHGHGEEGHGQGNGHGHGEEGHGQGNGHGHGEEGHGQGNGHGEEGHVHNGGNGHGHGEGHEKGSHGEEAHGGGEHGQRGGGLLGQIGGLLGDTVGQVAEGTLGKVGKHKGGLINGVLGSFYAPDPKSEIPPHVLRRIMRFCTKHPGHEKCQNHPEWVAAEGQLPAEPAGGLLDEVLNFPKQLKFHLRPVPKLRLKHLLEGVPDEFVKRLPHGLAKKLDEQSKQALKNLCAGGICLSQKPEFLNNRAGIAEQEAALLKKILPNKAVEEIDNDVELRLQRVYNVKKAVVKKVGLDQEVDPANDGTFQHDILLTESQSNALINQLESTEEHVAAIPEQPPELISAGSTSPGRAKRAGNSLFLEIANAERWPVGEQIPFVMDKSLAETDKSAVRAALNLIQSKSCIRFREMAAQPGGPHLYYVKWANPTFCGLSYVGRVQPANPVYLSFMCGNPMGVAIHETLHALGLQHEQQRPDRDNFIAINWNNVDPQRYDFFAVSDSAKFTSYGIIYDFGSVMHYSSNIAARQPNMKTMTAKVNPAANDPLMGQRNGLSQSDVLALKRMYCSPPGCGDSNVYCGIWATQNMCYANGQPHVWMQQNCRKSCSFCQ